MRYEELTIEGRNAVLEAFRSGKTIDKLFVLDGCQDGPVRTILREARKYDTIINYVPKERLDQISETGKHQGVIAYAAAYEYAEVEDMRAALPHTVRRHRGSPQPGSHHPYSQPGRGPRRHYSQTPCRGTDSHRGKDIGRSLKLYAGSQGHKSDGHHGRFEEKGHVVCLRRYGRRAYV